MSTNLKTGEGNIVPILGDDERPSSFPVIQHSSGLADGQVIVANVLDSGDDPDFGHGRDRVGGSREGNLKAAGGANGGLSVSTDGRKTESEERQREHSGVGESKGGSNWIDSSSLSINPQPPTSLYLMGRERLGCRSTDKSERKH